MKKIYFIRHGQSEGNVSSVYQSSDSPLTDVGVSQAKRVAERISRIAFDACISSPYPRAKSTALEVEKMTGKQVEYSDLFVERIKPSSLLGKAIGSTGSEELFTLWEKALCTPGMKAEDGETFNRITTRAKNALKFLEEREEETLVVVTHGYFLRALVAFVLFGEELTPHEFKRIQLALGTENTGLTVFLHDETKKPFPWKLWIYNDHTHLG
ncbi:MAG: histidine phosphatase family protein [Candidatus Paceibacterota bacterium]